VNYGSVIGSKVRLPSFFQIFIHSTSFSHTFLRNWHNLLSRLWHPQQEDLDALGFQPRPLGTSPRSSWW
jgi:hypothetical protein